MRARSKSVPIGVDVELPEGTLDPYSHFVRAFRDSDEDHIVVTWIELTAAEAAVREAQNSRQDRILEKMYKFLRDRLGDD